MDKKMKTIILSLQDMALIKIVTSLCNESITIQDIFAHPDLRPTSHTSYTLYRVGGNIETLDLPVALRRRLHSITGPITEHIRTWLLSDYAIDYISPKYLHLFYWTSQGTLDTTSTLMGLLRNEEISVFDRFRMACRCCLESEIHSLWDRITKNSLDPSKIQLLFSNGIVKFWTFKMDPNINRLPHIRHNKWNPQSINFLHIIREAVTDNNFPAVKYFFPKLTNEEKKKFWSDFSSNIFTTVARNYPSTILHFVFTSMDQEYQNELLNKYCCEILFTFLYWPWLNHFLEYSKLCWNFLSPNQFCSLLIVILLRRESFSRNQRCNYDVLFEEFWIQTPISFRKFMIRHNFGHLFKFLDGADEDKISQFLEHTSVEERIGIIFSDCGMESCKYFMERYWWHLSSHFLAECLPTAELVVNFRKDFEQFLLENFDSEKSKPLKGVDVIFDALLKKRSDEEN